MLRTITIPTNVFAAIWASRQGGEESEAQILRRLLGCEPAEKDNISAKRIDSTSGVHDNRNGVHFPYGFVIFRTYKRCEYEAIAQDGAWLRRDTGDLYPTLNQLNMSITVGAENIWNGNWKYRAEDGTIRSINDLRQ